jgi:C-terminal processing protease CtpA/Prc
VKDLKREIVKVARAARRDPAYKLEVLGGIAVLTIHDFDRVPSDELVAELGSVKDRGADRLLVDLRDAAAMNTRRASGLAELFASGAFLRLADRNGRAVETMTGARAKPAWSGPLAVLVNGATAASLAMLHERGGIVARPGGRVLLKDGFVRANFLVGFRQEA